MSIASWPSEADMPLNRNQMAWRAAQDIREGSLVNLGLGMPILVSDHLPAGRDVFFQSENGIVGVGPAAAADQADTDLVDAGSRPITLRPGASIVDSAWSFGMIRGGHIDVTILGAFEVAANGDLANWDSRIPHKGPLVGGAMDLAVGAREVWIVMEHNTRKGAPRLLSACTLPLTAQRCVTRVYTDIAVVDVTKRGFVVREVLAEISREELVRRTGASLAFANDCRPLSAPALADAGAP
jgi:3-oxoadipate CoA-transferase, beta subunit